MASIAIMIGGAVLNAAAFTGGNYLAKYIAGDSGKAALAEKTRHDKALEAYQNAMEKYTRERTQLLDWVETNREVKAQADQNFTNTDYAFKLQPGPSRLQINPAKKAEFLGHVSAKRAAETGRASFCRRGRACAWLRGFSFSLNIFSP